MQKRIPVFLVLALVCLMANASPSSLPKPVERQLPAGYRVLTFKAADLNSDRLTDYLVVAHVPAEKEIASRGGQTPRRPLMIFTQTPAGDFILAVRNNHIVYAVDEGGQCDPFLDSGDGLATSGRYFTVENGVACGAHWTDYITFKYVAALKSWVFHKRINEIWILTDGRDPDGGALVREYSQVSSGKVGKPILLQDYRPD